MKMLPGSAIKMNGTRAYLLLLLCGMPGGLLMAQGTVSFQCNALHLDKTISLRCDPVSEDDPGDLDEAYSYLIAFLDKSSDDRIELRFPAKVKSWRWTQQTEHDKTDSLAAYLLYNTDPKVYGRDLQAYPKDLTITVTRYEHKKGGVIEGTFEGTMQADLSWSHQTVVIPVKGNFQTTRTGRTPDDNRKQRRSEEPVISHTVKVFEDALLQPLQNSGWRISDEHNAIHSNVSNRSDLPITISLLTLKLAVDPHSAYGKRIQDSAQYYMEQTQKNTPGTKTYAAAAKNFFRVNNMLTAEIYIASNLNYLKESLYTIGDKDKYSVLHIPGASYACRAYKAPADEISRPEESTRLFFGNWKGADMHANTIVNYPFIHKQGPYIENFVVTITASAATADKIIQAIDWNKLNAAIAN
jgi:hypothetical protein